MAQKRISKKELAIGVPMVINGKDPEGLLTTGVPICELLAI
jgi:hypothetical protein